MVDGKKDLFGKIDFNKICEDYGIRVSSYASSPKAAKRLGSI